MRRACARWASATLWAKGTISSSGECSTSSGANGPGSMIGEHNTRWASVMTSVGPHARRSTGGAMTAAAGTSCRAARSTARFPPEEIPRT
jgi:hypothetical protein